MKEATEVMFRKSTFSLDEGEVYAIFPYLQHKYGFCTTYAHIGQHSGAEYNHCIRNSRPAKENEYRELKKELIRQGYNLKVIQRRNYSRYVDTILK